MSGTARIEVYSVGNQVIKPLFTMYAASQSLLTNLLYGVSPWDVVTLTGVGATVFGVSVAASLLPAIRAA